jgi:hypothetical protein
MNLMRRDTYRCVIELTILKAVKHSMGKYTNKLKTAENVTFPLRAITTLDSTFFWSLQLLL